MDLLKTAGLLKTVAQIGRCYDMLVKEFIVNVSPEVGQRRHADFHKVFARGQCIQFSPAEINKYLGRSDEDEEEEVSLNQVVMEITPN
jgi:hypothetical protein